MDVGSACLSVVDKEAASCHEAVQRQGGRRLHFERKAVAAQWEQETHWGLGGTEGPFHCTVNSMGLRRLQLLKHLHCPSQPQGGAR